MPVIEIQITGKIAQTVGQPVIVCGNSDYSIQFTFDSEWDIYEAKTARFVYRKGSSLYHQDILFTDDTCTVPVLYDTDCVAVGVYAGNIHTSTPASIPCAHCITDDEPVHPEPDPDVYVQILSYLAGLDTIGIITGNAILLTNGTDLSAVGAASEWEAV